MSLAIGKTAIGGLIIVGCVSLYGCAGQHSESAIQEASVDFQKVKEDSNVLRIAPKDVIRAGESLARADRLSSYWGSGSDVVHYAYLSRRYSEIAREHTNPNCSVCSSRVNGSKNRSSRWRPPKPNVVW
jgi:hypothetical protein